MVLILDQISPIANIWIGWGCWDSYQGWIITKSNLWHCDLVTWLSSCLSYAAPHRKKAPALWASGLQKAYFITLKNFPSPFILFTAQFLSCRIFCQGDCIHHIPGWQPSAARVGVGYNNLLHPMMLKAVFPASICMLHSTHSFFTDPISEGNMLGRSILHLPFALSHICHIFHWSDSYRPAEEDKHAAASSWLTPTLKVNSVVWIIHSTCLAWLQTTQLLCSTVTQCSIFGS